MASKKPGVTKFPALATGEYWIVLRPAGAQSDAGVGYTVTVTNAAAKAPRAPKGIATYDGSKSLPAATVQFDAAEGLTLAGSLKGPLSSTPPSLHSPDGTEIPVTLVPGKKVKLRAAEPFGGPLTVRVGKNDHAISRELAAGIGVI